MPMLEDILVELSGKLDHIMKTQREQADYILRLQNSILAIASEAGMVGIVVDIMKTPSEMKP